MNIFFSFILRQPSELQCFAKGECEKGHFLGNSPSTNVDNCHNFCHKLKGCKWFTYRPSNKVCQAFSECSRLNFSRCSTCISGEIGCKTTTNCRTKGVCTGNLLSTVMFDCNLSLLLGVGGFNTRDKRQDLT